MPAMARHQDRRKLLMLALVLQLVGFCGFIWLPLQLPVLWAMVCGLGLGGAFPLCLLLALDHSVQPAIAGKLGGVYAGNRFYHRRACPVGFLACCVVSAAIT
ncbi:cyanate transporter [Escherichia coli]|uniref:Cyanate transporter n=1 Tax=Escherichia coli TaxID=562 RepID=A0A376L2W0_ECOLX|nr:cyanate transporter [Escherichia coli]